MRKTMATLTPEQAMEGIYASLNNDNEDIDARIADLKEALSAIGEKSIIADPTRLAQSNREGRKMMQSYFKRKGIVVNFKK